MKILKYTLVLLFCVTLWGCGKGNSASVMIDPSTGKHSTGWAVGGVGGVHVSAYFANPNSCEGCHGKPEDLAGGISKVSCSSVSRNGMSCHGGKWPHGEGFDVPSVHGTQVVNKGLGLCQKCHGWNYKGMIGLGVSCIACHQNPAVGGNPANMAPHAMDWTTGTPAHSATNPIFAPACGECHYFPGSPATVNAPRTTPVIQYGTTPTCMGSTGTAMCHTSGGHGIPYTSPSAHGVAAHNSGPMYCGTCHATHTIPPSFTLDPNNNENLQGSGCENCHTGEVAGALTGTGLAHPYGWLPGRGQSSTTTHTTANSGASGEQCSPCHTLASTNGVPASGPSPNAPSCMTIVARIGSTTYCHFTNPPAGPLANTGCGSCHGVATTNGRPDGTVAPNRNYRHAGHFAATGLTGLTCAVCHLNKGTGETDHSTINLTVNTAAVVIPGVAASPSYSDGGQGVYNGSAAGTCTFVSCHGGKALQATALLYKWRNGGVISGDADCTRCHTVSSAPPATYAGPYIGPFSGYTSVINGGSQNLHQYHVGSQSLSCVVCHDKNKAHSRMLQGTRSIKVAGFAKPTLKTSFTYTVTSTTLNTSTCSNVGCHFDVTTRSWYKN